MADPPPGRSNEPLPDEFDASVNDVPGLPDVVADATEAVAVLPAGAVRVSRGRSGVVVRIHAQAWSLVFRLGGRVLVVLDDAPHTAWRIDRDQAWATEVRSMIDGVMRELDRRGAWQAVTAIPGPVNGGSMRAGPTAGTGFDLRR